MSQKKYLFPLVLVIIIAGFIGLVVYAIKNPAPDPLLAMNSREVAGTCTSDAFTKYHIHSHLTLIVDKQQAVVPGEIGVDKETNCMHPIHTHGTDGLIHVESPVQKDFTLGDFFYLWGKTFNSNQLDQNKVDTEHGLKFYVDGKESDQFENLALKDHHDIVIDYYTLKDGPDKLPEPYKFAE